MFTLIPRVTCPACLDDVGQTTLFEAPYAALTGFLEKSYIADSIKRHLSDIVRHDYVIVQCGRCGLLYQKFVPDEAAMTTLYTELISPDETYERHRFHMDTLTYYERHVRDVFSVFRHIGRHPSRIRALDFGAGWAQWARVAKSVGAEVSISEISENQIANSREFGINNIDIFTYSGPLFDYIHTQDVFEHLPEPNKILLRLSKLLKKGGVIRLAVPPGFAMKSRIERFAARHLERLPELAPLQHINSYAQPTLRRFAGQFGLEPIFIAPKFPRASDYVKSLAFHSEALLNTALYRLTGKRIAPYPYFVATNGPEA